MTYVVTEVCIKCKYTDCVEVCPVDCFYEGENMLVIHPDECIDCGVCEPECPAEAIVPDTAPGLDKVEVFGARKDIQGNRTSFSYGYGGELQTTLPAGDYVVVASPAEGADKEKAISVVAGERLEVTVE